MTLLRTLSNGFQIHGGKITVDEEAEFYSRISRGPKIILHAQKPPALALRETGAPPQSPGEQRHSSKLVQDDQSSPGLRR